MDFLTVQVFWHLHEVLRSRVDDNRKNNTHTQVCTCKHTDVCTCTPMNTRIHIHISVQHTPEHTRVFLSTAPEGNRCSRGKDSVINRVWDTRHPPFLAESQSAAVTGPLKNLALKSPFPSAFLRRSRPAALGVSGDAALGLWTPALVLSTGGGSTRHHLSALRPSLRISNPRFHMASLWGALLGKSPSFPLRCGAGANEGWAFTPAAVALTSHILLWGVDPTHEGVGFLMAWVLS